MEKNIVIKDGTGEIEEKKSRFIAHVKAVQSEEDAIEFINAIKKKYWDARHNCMAYQIGDVKRFSDDGEPQGTAGKPILEVIEGRNIDNVVIVVTRYFGGVLLGTGGLLRAYQKSAIEGINNSVIAKKCEGFQTDIRTDYNGLGKITYLANTNDVCIMNTEYAEAVTITIACESEKYDRFISQVVEGTAGKAEIAEKIKISFYMGDHGVEII